MMARGFPEALIIPDVRAAREANGVAGQREGMELDRPGDRARPERGSTLALRAFNRNRAQQTTPRFTEAELHEAMTPRRDG